MAEEPKWIVKKVSVEDNYMLRLLFADNCERLFDFKPYLNKKPFEELRDYNKFSRVRTDGDSVIWDNGIDIAPEELYEKSIEV